MDPAAAALSVLVAVAVPTAILMVVWTLVAVSRILVPEQPLPFVRDEVAERRAASARGESVGVGFREIHDDMRVHVRELACPYRHAVGHPYGIPDVWVADVYRRRN